MAKISLEELNRMIYPHCGQEDPDVVLGATFGEDVALTRIGSTLLASHVDPIIGAVQNIGWLAVHVACNDIATCGAPPRWIQVLVLVPKDEGEKRLQSIMEDIGRAANEVGVTVIGGHTEYSDSITRALVAVTALGTIAEGKQVLTKGAQPGDHILITKGIPLEGTAILAHDFAETAQKLGLTKDDLMEARSLMTQVSIVPEALILAQCGASAMHDVTEGGLLETLLEIALLSDVEIRVDFDKIPVPPVAHRFAKAFDFDLIKMISSGTLAASIPPEKLPEAEKALEQAGVLFADIGTVHQGQGVKIAQEGRVDSYEEVRPEIDELARLWEIHKPDRTD